MKPWRNRLSSVLVAGAAALPALALATPLTVIDFEHTNAVDSGAIMDYAGLTWDNVLLADTTAWTRAFSGFESAATSGIYAAYNGTYGDASFSLASGFNLLSMSVTNGSSSFQGNSVFLGYQGDTLRYTLDVANSGDYATTVNFGWSGVTKVVMVGNGSNYTAFDDVAISIPAAAVPEPSAWALLLGGLALMGVVARRRA